MNPLIDVERNLTVERIIEDFSQKGVEVSIEEAEKYLDLIYFLARLVVDQNFLE